MIVQTMAIEHPERLLTMTSVMSSTGEAGYMKSSARAAQLLTAPPVTDRAGVIQAWVDGQREWGGPAYADEERWRIEAGRAFDRSFHPSGSGRQYLAIRASVDRAEALRSVTVPTLVMHGDKDTLIDQIGGRRTAELIPGARFELIAGMGHDYPPQLWRTWVDLVVDHIRRNS
jgi:pimeloyl-ACP methyl ester carboxylesterase